MKQAFTRPFICPGCRDQAWVLVSIEGRVFDASVRPYASHSEAMTAFQRVTIDTDACEAFLRPVSCPGPSGYLVLWFGDDPMDVDVRAFPTRKAAWLELARRLEADPSDPEALSDAAELRRLAAERS